jgi:uncharacterized membrane protein
MTPYVMAALLGAACGIGEARGPEWGLIALACGLGLMLLIELVIAWRVTRRWN